MAKGIVVLFDGETWGDMGTLMVVTDEAYQELLDGAYPKHLDPDKDIVWEAPIN